MWRIEFWEGGYINKIDRCPEEALWMVYRRLAGNEIAEQAKLGIRTKSIGTRECKRNKEGQAWTERGRPG